jgi:hypothetical protein
MGIYATGLFVVRNWNSNRAARKTCYDPGI